MIVRCPDCDLRYDDESRWTICPHNSLNVAHDRAYCRRHDLYEPCAACAVELPVRVSVAPDFAVTVVRDSVASIPGSLQAPPAEQPETHTSACGQTKKDAQ